MTPERLREIAERHTMGEEWIPTARVVDLPVAQVAHADRGDLLVLIRDLADAARRYLDAPKHGMGSGTIAVEAEGRLRSLLRRVDDRTREG